MFMSLIKKWYMLRRPLSLSGSRMTLGIAMTVMIAHVGIAVFCHLTVTCNCRLVSRCVKNLFFSTRLKLTAFFWWSSATAMRSLWASWTCSKNMTPSMKDVAAQGLHPILIYEQLFMQLGKTMMVNRVITGIAGHHRCRWPVILAGKVRMFAFFGEKLLDD